MLSIVVLASALSGVFSGLPQESSPETVSRRITDQFLSTRPENYYIMYADTMTDSMKNAMDETNRRRRIQNQYNLDNGIVPTTVVKEIRPPIHNTEDEISDIISASKKATRSELQKKIKELEKQMKEAARTFDFERAAKLRDIIFEMKAEL